MSPQRKRGLLILAAGLAVALVLCVGVGVGGWLLLRDPDREGAATPTAAVQSFLQAVYRDQDPAAAAALVCSEARDEDALAAKINELRAYRETQVEPRFQWSTPEVVEEHEELAVVLVTVTMITGDERIADQSLRVSVLDKEPHGWWVCNLETTDEAAVGDGEPDDEDGPDGETDDDADGDGESGND